MSEEPGDRPKSKQRAVAPSNGKKKNTKHSSKPSEDTRVALFGDLANEDHNRAVSPRNDHDQVQISAQNSKESLQNAIRAAAEADSTAGSAMVKLAEQKEQIQKIDQDLADINDTQNKSERVIKGMSSFGGAVKNLFTSGKTPTGQTKYGAKSAYDPSSVSKEGFLIKQGAVVKSWRSRYFVIVKEAAYYYKTQEEAKMAGQPKGAISLAGASVQPCESFKHDKIAHCFSVVSPLMQRTFYLSAASDEDRDKWIGSLKHPGVAYADGPVDLTPKKKSSDDKNSTPKTATQAIKEEQDEQLEVLSNLMVNLKNKGEAIGNELDQQNLLLEHVDGVIEKADARIVDHTQKMKKIK